MNWIELIKRSAEKYYFNNYENNTTKTFFKNNYNCRSKSIEEFLICSNPYFSMHVVDRLGGIDAKDWSNQLKAIYQRIFGDVDKISGDIFFRACREVGRHKFIRYRKNKKQTSVCEVYLTWQKDFNIEVSSQDIELRSSTASGPGGQNRDKGNSKSQIIYKPLGIVIQEEGSRSLSDNHNKNLIKLKGMVIDRMKRDLGEGIFQLDSTVRIYEFNNKLYIPTHPSLDVEDVIKNSIFS